jgi:MoaA/NifB/PqqE/SkfB family radical SAM enzyme
MPTRYYLNLNYVCNERCVFCASDLTNTVRLDGRGAWVTLDEVRHWLGDTLPSDEDRVLLAGGEPSLHRELLPITRLLSVDCSRITIFTNGVKFADAAFARAAVEAGITEFQIALFGSTAEQHESITRLRGSFDRTLTALEVLGALPATTVKVRLLVSRQCAAGNPAIVELLHQRGLRVDAVSLNRLILSDNARNSDAAIAWDEARPWVNATARLVREYGYDLEFAAIPLCVYEDDNADYIRREVVKPHPEARPVWNFRYFDPVLASGQRLPERSSQAPLAEPAACTLCDYRPACGRVEDWYAARFGEAGLHAIHLG